MRTQVSKTDVVHIELTERSGAVRFRPHASDSGEFLSKRHDVAQLHVHHFGRTTTVFQEDKPSEIRSATLIVGLTICRVANQ